MIEVWYRTLLAFPNDYHAKRKPWASWANRDSFCSPKVVSWWTKLRTWPIKECYYQSIACKWLKPRPYLPSPLIFFYAILQHKRLRSASPMLVDVLTVIYTVYSIKVRLICLIYKQSPRVFWYRPQHYACWSISERPQALVVYWAYVNLTSILNILHITLTYGISCTFWGTHEQEKGKKGRMNKRKEEYTWNFHVWFSQLWERLVEP